MSLIEQIKNLLNRGYDDVKNHRRSMSAVSTRPLGGGFRVNISKCMKDVGIDYPIDEDFDNYDGGVMKGMYAFAIDQLKIKIAKAKRKGVSREELNMLTVKVQLFTSRVKRYMIVYACDEERGLRWEPIKLRYGLASYHAEVRGDDDYCLLYSDTEGRKQIKEALEA